ncbi:hypothetical protein BS78_02G312200 [Paspalum vaginatum]|nr:hypothetical protein BS78_02G312200 [Paspalum vaginatum]
MASPTGEALPFSDDLLADILIRLPTIEDLGRACASCPAFRRVITSHSFLRRLHALHPPSLLGFHTYSALFHPVEAPHPSAPAARALAEAADFKFSFLPSPGFWMVRDAHGGRFVLDRDEGTDPTFTTIAVCDPLFRRYVLLPPIPEDLVAAVKQPVHVNPERRCHVFFAPCSKEEAGGAPQAFSVIWMAECPTKVVTFLFSSASGQWRAIASARWRDLNPACSPETKHSNLCWRSYAYGCFYWCLSGFPDHSNVIVLDIGRMEFYPVNYPFFHRFQEFAIVELEEGRRGMFMFSTNYNEGSSVLLLFSANNQINAGGVSEWMLEKHVSLSRGYSFKMLGVADGKLLMQGTRTGHSSSAPEFGCMSLDFKSSQLQRVRGMIHPESCPMLAQYTGYPPSLSLPTI